MEVKLRPMWKDQGLGPVVSKLLFLSYDNDMAVFKIVRLKKERVT